MPQDEINEPGRVHRVGEVKIGLSRRDFQSILLVRRRLQAIYLEARFATPTDLGGLFDVLNGALPRTTEAIWDLLNVSRGTGMVSYIGEEDEDQGEGIPPE